jgi:hypothetical protein
MSTHYTSSHSFPFDLSWTPQDLADAAPLRLFELVTFDAGSDHASNAAASASTRRDWRRRDYVRLSDLPTFIRVHS